MLYGVDEFLPGIFQLFIKEVSLFCEAEIFPGRSCQAFHPPVREKVGILESGQQGIEGAFQDVEVGFFHFFNDVAGICFRSFNNREDAELQHSFSHLALGVVDVHGILIMCFGDESEQNSSRCFTRKIDSSACVSINIPSFCSIDRTKICHCLVLCKTKYIIYKSTKQYVVL